MKQVLLSSICSAMVFSSTVNAFEVNFVVNGQTYTQIFDDSAVGAKAFKNVLPIEVCFEDYGRTERIAFLKSKFSDIDQNVVHEPKIGDFTYYVPWGNLAVFVKDFKSSNGLLYIGHLHDELLNAIKNSGSSKVIISLKSER